MSKPDFAAALKMLDKAIEGFQTLDKAEKDRTVAAKVAADTEITNWKRLNPQIAN